MKKLGALVFLAALLAPASAMAAVYTQQDASACTPDAFRLCGEAIPDADRVVQCLIVNRQNLSPACNAVFERLGAIYGHRRPVNVRRATY